MLLWPLNLASLSRVLDEAERFKHSLGFGSDHVHPIRTGWLLVLVVWVF